MNWWLPSKKYPEIETSENPLGISADFVFHKPKKTCHRWQVFYD
ncbi:hypothetical protein EC07798_4604 [Escherichia coli 07798]|nr:hypothetical protein EC07798_4604 [Escherichia coli 07798]